MLLHCTGYIAVAGIVGATLAFPGPAAVNFGHFTDITRLTGLAADVSMWVLSPAIAALITSVGFMWIRGTIFRGEDVFHQVLWVCRHYVGVLLIEDLLRVGALSKKLSVMKLTEGLAVLLLRLVT